MSGRAGQASAWLVYLLRCSDGTLYCGVTNDLERRLAAHNAGKGARYTRARLPVALAAWAACDGKSSALKAEAAVRKQKAADKVAFVRRLAQGEIS